MPRRLRMTARLEGTHRRIDRLSQPVMVMLSYAFLTAVAIAGLPVAVMLLADALPAAGGALSTTGHDYGHSPALMHHATILLVTCLWILWPIFFVEALFRIFYLERRSGANLRRQSAVLFAAIFPPLRLGLTPCSALNVVWFPFLGWNTRNKLLAKDLARGFSLPMILFALAVIPLIAIEFVMLSKGAASADAIFTFTLGTQIVWLAFAVEFFTRLAGHERKIEYCKKHWVDAAIVLLPLISFLRLARLATLMRAGRLSQMGRIYRLRGLAQRGYQALLILRVLERWSLWGAKARINSLQTKIERMHDEIEDYHEEIAELQAMMQSAHAARMKIDRLRAAKRKAKRNKTSGLQKVSPPLDIKKLNSTEGGSKLS